MNRKVKVNLEIRLKVHTALSIGGSNTEDLGVDKAIAKDRDGQPYIPGSSFKGRLRHECQRIAKALGYKVCLGPKPEDMCPHVSGVSSVPCPVCSLFGSAWYPARLKFSDLRLASESVQTSIATRPGVSINRRRGTAEDGRLYFTSITGPGAEPVFEGNITGWLDHENHESFLGLLLAGLKTMENIGGGRSHGLGWCTIAVEKIEVLGTNQGAVDAGSLIGHFTSGSGRAIP